MKRKIIITISVALLIGGIYLNRSYADIYNHIDSENLASRAFDYSSPIEIGNTADESPIYVAMGDSLTYGVGASSIENTFPYYFAGSLLSQYRGVKMFNLGVPGATIEDLIDYQLEQTIDLKPDYVSVFIGTNDIHQTILPNKFGSSLAYTLERLSKETDAQIIIINLPYLGSKSLILPPFNYFFDSYTREYNKVIQEMVDVYELKLVELYDSTKNAFLQRQELYSSDGLHPSDEGYKYWSKFIYAN